MVPFPNTLAPLVSKAGNVLRPWIQFFSQFVIAPPNVMSIVPTGSPFDYVGKEPGSLVVSGGTVSDITLIRGAISTTMATSTASPRIIPVSINDTIRITYTVLPTVTFIPSYGQNTNV